MKEIRIGLYDYLPLLPAQRAVQARLDKEHSLECLAQHLEQDTDAKADSARNGAPAQILRHHYHQHHHHRSRAKRCNRQSEAHS